MKNEREEEGKEEKKKGWDNKKSKNMDNIVFLLLLDNGQKSCMKFGELQVFGYLLNPSFFIF